MIETKKTVRDTLCRTLAAELDPYMETQGFSRDNNSLDYIRQCEAGEQLLQMHFTFRPRLDPQASAHIYPELMLSFSIVNQIASEMVGGVHGVIGATDATLWQPLEFSVPKNCRVYWFIYGRDEDYVLNVRSIQGYVEKWIIPFLNEYTSIESLANYFEKKDERIQAQRHFYIYVAAAYVLLGRPEKALEVLEAKFGRPGARRKYAKAFEYVRNRIASIQ